MKSSAACPSVIGPQSSSVSSKAYHAEKPQAGSGSQREPSRAGWPVPRLRLRERLARRGLALSAAILASALTQDVRALTVPPSLVNSTIQVATLVATGSSLAGVTSAPVVTLTEGVLKAMLLSKLKFAFLALVTVALVTTGAGVVAQDRPSDDDRLKNLERKVDKLLEVLGGSNRHSPAPDPAPRSRPAPIATAPA